ncbi:MAG TPA: AIM24 family protein [Actinomycetota bacterium]|nr:AIM24 family protein [Actinomycetota bacterium]
MNHEIRGDWSQIVVCRLDDGQKIYSQTGRFLWKTANVRVEEHAPARGIGDASHGKGLLGRALSAGNRTPSGPPVALPHFRVQEGSGLCAFTGASPGEIRQIELGGSLTWTVSRDAFVAAEGTVGLRVGSGTPNLIRFTGPGSLFIAAGGSFLDLNPADHDGVIHADIETVVAFEGGVAMAVHDDAGVSVAVLKGDGKVILRA